MPNLVVVENPRNWRLHTPGAQVVAARDYLTDPALAAMPRARVFNLCRSHRYQTTGYYVSLLAAARGHRPQPSIETLQDLRLDALVRIAGQDLDARIQRALAPLKSDAFEVSVYFGSNLSARYDTLARAIYEQFPAPLLRASFQRGRSGRWRLDGVRVLGTAEIPPEHREFVAAQAERFFDRPIRARKQKTARWELAILWDAGDPMPASNARAIKRFCAAAGDAGLRATVIGPADAGRIPSFDALFIRQTTKVDHHTFRFARAAKAEGLVVVDDPESIIRCANKVYLAELLAREGLPTPRTVIFAVENAASVGAQLGFPCVIKKPDSSFSVGVVKAGTREEFDAMLPAMFADSELMVAQEFVPTEFDWRIGVLDGAPLYACQYFMAEKHWQIYDHSGGRTRYGNFKTWRLEEVPPAVVDLGVRAARLIGRGLYGVDLKLVDGRPVVIEINDNPTLDAGIEDQVLGDALYARVMQWFAARLDERGR
jgi:glutathione synthase/RimK-type ligase-like ATP-grasp enzyme